MKLKTFSDSSGIRSEHSQKARTRLYRSMDADRICDCDRRGGCEILSLNIVCAMPNCSDNVCRVKPHCMFSARAVLVMYVLDVVSVWTQALKSGS